MCLRGRTGRDGATGFGCPEQSLKGVIRGHESLSRNSTCGGGELPHCEPSERAFVLLVRPSRVVLNATGGEHVDRRQRLAAEHERYEVMNLVPWSAADGAAVTVAGEHFGSQLPPSRVTDGGV